MTEASHNVFIDRRTPEQQANELATPVLFWYDEEGKGKKRRRRTNGLAITTDRLLLVARATCSRKDQFVKSLGRLVVEKRILGRAKKHCYRLMIDDGDVAEMAAAAYTQVFPEDERGIKRAFNAGRIFNRYQEEIRRLADEMLDEG